MKILMHIRKKKIEEVNTIEKKRIKIFLNNQLCLIIISNNLVFLKNRRAYNDTINIKREIYIKENIKQ